MPTKRTRKTRHTLAPVSEAVRYVLQYGELPNGDSDLGGWLDAFIKIGSAEALERDWLAVRDELLATWIADRPGTRPHGWWFFDAPRWRGGPFPGRMQTLAEHLRTIAEPRKRLGGSGTVAGEVLNIWPHFRFGLPLEWVSAFDARYYRGAAVDVHGRPIGHEFRGSGFSGVAPDPHDPPRFESEAAYLDRYGLLTAAERSRLGPEAFKPEPLIIADEERLQ
jgi:hypothetical protein